jgi:hypothetical protein
MSASLTATEEAQLLQTIEMFDVITQSQPFDYESLEILKEAYSRLGRQKEMLDTARRVAEAYVHLGQLSSAILEYESILQQFPGEAEVQKALVEIENRANTISGAAPPAEMDLMEKPGPVEHQPGHRTAALEIEDGRQAMYKFFVEDKLISGADFDLCWPVPDLNAPPKQVIEPFIQQLAERAIFSMDQSLKVLSEKSRLGFLPLDKYDVDVEVARAFSREICWRWCVLPFDKMSKSVLVATANPFNRQAARDLEGMTENRLLWYLATPGELVKIIRKIHR